MSHSIYTCRALGSNVGSTVGAVPMTLGMIHTRLQ
jgi:hypothetical protein